uniref:Small ribosomal subunit protein uS8c n=1 Tax=Austrotaxus spicata TaxID=89478 RepID=A0A8F8STV2_9CONI|nr:ribosomal protein S8 [Austrotaxus spicata]
MTFIRNANMVKKKTVRVTDTIIIGNIARILLREGFLEDVREHREGKKSFLVLTSKSRERKEKRNIIALDRISRPGLRIYSTYRDIPKVLGGMGIVILSTTQGIMTDREAREKKVGGELLCILW